MTRRCLLAGVHISAVWVDNRGWYALDKMLAVKVAIPPWKCMLVPAQKISVMQVCKQVIEQ